MAGTRDDLAYSVRVQDRDLKRLAPILRQVRKELAATNTTASGTGNATAAGLGRARTQARGLERDLNRVTRGALAGSGALKGIGRSIAFGSLGFIGAASVTAGIRSTIEAASESQKVEAQMRQQFRASRLELGQYEKTVHGVIQAQSQLAAVDDEDLTRSFTTLLRVTGDVNASMKLNAVAADLAAAKHMDVVSAATLVGKVYGGNTQILRRQGFAISKNMTPLQALEYLQKRVAGQAVTVGKQGEGAYRRLQVNVDNVKEAIGMGLIPELSKSANEISTKLAAPATQRRLQEIAHTLSVGVAGGAREVAADVRTAWPAIVATFKAARIGARGIATGLHAAADAERELAKITPGGDDTVMGAIVGGLLLRRLTSANTRAKLLGVTLARLNVPVVGGSLLGIGAVYEAAKNAPGNPFGRLGGFIGSKAFDAVNAVAPGLATSLADSSSSAVATGGTAGAKKAADKTKSLFGASLKDLHPVSDAMIAASAAKLKKRFEDAVSSMDDIFGRVRDKSLSVFDARTSDMEERLKAIVRIGNQRFTITASGKTPAERELEALDRIDSRRHLGRDLRDSRERLVQARRLGDPRLIREAEEQVQDAQTAIRRNKLEQRATVERKAADKSIERTKKEFQSRRDLMREHFSDELDAIQKRLDSGKLKESQARTLIVGTLRKYGVDLKSAGDSLGKAFSTGLGESLQTLYSRTKSVSGAFAAMTSNGRINAVKRLAKATDELAASIDKMNVSRMATPSAGGGGRGSATAPNMRGTSNVPSSFIGATPGHLTGDFTTAGFVQPGDPVLSAAGRNSPGGLLGGTSPTAAFGRGKYPYGLKLVAWQGLQNIFKLFGHGNVNVTAGYAGAGHAQAGDHPRGMAVDLAPSKWNQTTVNLYDRIAQWGMANRKHVRWIGWRGMAGHGPPPPWGTEPVSKAHLHMSFMRHGGLVDGAFGRDVIPAMLTRRERVLSPEQNVSLTRAIGRLGGGGDTYYVEINAQTNASARDIADEVETVLQRKAKRSVKMNRGPLRGQGRRGVN